MFVRINNLRKRGKEMKELLCVLTVFTFIVVFSLSQLVVLLLRKKINSRRYLSNERPHFIFYSYRLLIKFCFLYADFTGCIHGIMALLYKRHHTYLQLKSFCHTINYYFFEGYIVQFPLKISYLFFKLTI